MGTPLEQLATANAEITRLTGIESQFSTLRAQIPGGDVASLTTLIAEHGQFKADAERLTGELSTAATENARLTSEISRLTADLETARAAVPLEQQVEQRSAEIVAGAGVPAVVADTKKADTSGEPQNAESFFAEYDRLHAESPAKAAAYWQQWNTKF